MVLEFLSRCKRLAQVCVVLALPIGISSDPENSADYALGVYAGTGKYISLVEGCEAPPRSTANTFAEGAAAAFVRVPTKSHSPLVLGLSGGLWHSDITLVGDYVYDEQTREFSVQNRHLGKITYGYVIPSVSLEAPAAGIGIGVLLGKYPVYFDRNIDFSPHVSGHIRLGHSDGFHLSYSMNENLPLNSGGGTGNLGIGCALGGAVMMCNGLSFGGYHGVGLAHQLRIPLDRASAIDVSLRWGPKEEHAAASEFGLGIGFRRYFGKF
jgi:hypothetical protein